MTGTPTHRFEASIGIAAIARIDADHLAVGYDNGNIELLTSRTATPGDVPTTRSGYSFERTPSSPVTRILSGPMNTLIAGFGNGAVGVWSWRDGKRLADGRTHGPIEHLLLENHRLYAASALGQHLMWDLSTLYDERCTLLREVWASVPVVWQDARAITVPPPAKHPCHAEAQQ